VPELPEVEFARRRFLAGMEGRVIDDARALDALVVPQPASLFREALVGRRVEGAERRGKHVVVRLSGDRGLWFHLGMSGRLVPLGAPDEPTDASTGLPRFTRWWLKTGDLTACLCDTRRLGRAVAGTLEEARAHLAGLGPDALDVKDGAALGRCLEGARGPVKAALMDQTRLAGLGNIQVAEALFRAGLHPESAVPSLDRAARARLARAIQESLRDALAAMEGLETLVYVGAGGENPFAVYGRAGEPCPRCRSLIVREVARGRSSFFCPRCQPPPGTAPARGARTVAQRHSHRRRPST